MRRKIAIISEHASPLATLGGVDSGGQNVYVGQLGKHLGQLGFAVDIFTRWDDERLPQTVKWSNNVRVINVPAGPVQYIPKEDLMPHMSEFTGFLLDYIRENGDYHLIHANFWMSGLVAADIKLVTDTPFVVTFHALGWVRRMYQKSMDRFPEERFAVENRIVKESDWIIAECPQDREDLITYYHADEGKITIIPPGFDSQEFYPVDKALARMKLGINTNDKILLQLGRIVPRKGIDNVIRGTALLRKKYGVNAKLIIVGGDSQDPDPGRTPEIGRLQSVAAEEGVGEAIYFAGSKQRENLKFYYSAADIFVTTPWYEPFGMTPLESMACGTPVIGADVGGIKYSVIDGKTGYLVKPNDPESLAKQAGILLADAHRLQVFGENALFHVNSMFNWNSIANKVSTLFENIISRVNSSDDENFYHLHTIDSAFEDAIETYRKSLGYLRIPILDMTRIIQSALLHNRKILVCGNGGSATDASHFAAELVGRFKIEGRGALPVISLNENTAVITAWSNDYDYDDVFARQTEAYGSAGDVLIGISTSGMSVNLLKAFRAASKRNMVTVALTGKDGGDLAKLSDISVVVPSMETSRIQEVHIHIIHTVCEMVEKLIFISQSDKKQDTIQKSFNSAGHGLRVLKGRGMYANIE